MGIVQMEAFKNAEVMEQVIVGLAEMAEAHGEDSKTGRALVEHAKALRELFERTGMRRVLQLGQLQSLQQSAQGFEVHGTASGRFHIEGQTLDELHGEAIEEGGIRALMAGVEIEEG